MKVDAGLFASDLRRVPERARELEAEGCWNGLATGEIGNDPFFPLLLAAEHTQRLELATSIAVAFARNPMTLANIGHDLNAYSKGRFILGLGSQIEAHIRKRFSMPWSQPAPRMREFIQALHAIWDSWYDGKPLKFRGDFYSHTLMTPMFDPVKGDEAMRAVGRPRVFLSAVGPKMTEVAGEVADGLVAHGFTTERYLKEATLPALERGLARAGRKREDVEVSCPVFVIAGRDENEFAAQRKASAMQIAFYASTPAYRPVLELHGWGELQTELNRLSKLGKWAEMGEAISDDILEAFAIVSEPDRVAESIKARIGGSVDRLLCTFSISDPETMIEQVSALAAT
jgi:probable F420-dependent oxidoreductase